MELNLTDNQWYNFLCGFQAGMKLSSLTEPNYAETNTVIAPLPLIPGVIGIKGADTGFEDVDTTIIVPFSATSVNIIYSGFSVAVEYNTLQLELVGIEEGHFGTVGDSSSSAEVRYAESGGVIHVIGKKEKPRRFIYSSDEFRTIPKFYGAEVLFYLRFRRKVLNPPGDVYRLKIITTTPTDLNGTTLFQTVIDKNEEGESIERIFFIFPTDNGREVILRKIYSRVPPPVIKPEGPSIPVGNKSPVSTTSLPVGVYFQKSWSGPGKYGSLSFTIINPYDEEKPQREQYKYIKVIAEIIDLEHILRIDGVSGFGERSYWSLESKDTYNEETGRHTLEIIGEISDSVRQLSASGSVSFYIFAKGTGFEQLDITPQVVAFTIEPNEFGGLPAGDIYWGAGGEGYIYEKLSTPSNEPKTPNGKDTAIIITTLGGSPLEPDKVQRIPVDSVEGTGTVWSDSEQDIVVSFGDGNKQIIHLYPGPNEIKFWIPIIKEPGNEEYEERELKVEQVKKEGYILIEGGFSWSIIPKTESKDEVQQLVKFDQKLLDKVKVRDFIKYNLFHPTEPVNLDGLIDNISIVDFMSYQKITSTTKDSEHIDEFEIIDESSNFTEIKVEDGNLKKLESYTVEDFNAINIHGVEIEAKEESDSLSFGDIFEYKLEKGGEEE